VVDPRQAARFVPLVPLCLRFYDISGACNEALDDRAQRPLPKSRYLHGPGAVRQLERQRPKSKPSRIEIEDRAWERRNKTSCRDVVGAQMDRNCLHGDLWHVEPALPKCP